tara:strand:- start:8245 stop:8931 length:687 start_codon:yes stop_codon:yes gene_type:complete
MLMLSNKMSSPEEPSKETVSGSGSDDVEEDWEKSNFVDTFNFIATLERDLSTSLESTASHGSNSDNNLSDHVFPPAYQNYPESPSPKSSRTPESPQTPKLKVMVEEENDLSYFKELLTFPWDRVDENAPDLDFKSFWIEFLDLDTNDLDVIFEQIYEIWVTLPLEIQINLIKKMQEMPMEMEKNNITDKSKKDYMNKFIKLTYKYFKAENEKATDRMSQTTRKYMLRF